MASDTLDNGKQQEVQIPVIDELKDEKESQTSPAPKAAEPDTSPTVIFIGTRSVSGKKVKLTEAPRSLISGPDAFSDLPSSEEQLKGFYYERAAELCRAFPGLYKRLIKKGE